MRFLVVDDSQERIDRFKAIFKGVPRTNWSGLTQLLRDKRGTVIGTYTPMNWEPHIVDAAKTANDALDLLRTFSYNMACLDHDLGHAKRDGLLLAHWLSGKSMVMSSWGQPIKGFKCPVRKILIHSRNVVGAKRMADMFLDMPNPPAVRLLPYQPAPGV